MNKTLRLSVRLLAALLVSGLSCARPVHAKAPVYTNPAETDQDYPIQGEYAGTLQADREIKIGVQVIANGDGEFTSVSYAGGLPGTVDSVELLHRITAQRSDDGSVTFEGTQATGILANGEIRVVSDGNELGVLKRVDRKSPTLGKQPPEGAKVLFAGREKDVENWVDGKIVEGLLQQGTTSKDRFDDHHLHIEFRLPYAPLARGQGRGNSGLYLQGRYEVQMLDSFGLSGEDNECGGIYSIAAPDLNMCFPPLAWQTYDVDFTAARYDDQGELLKNARMTVKHNGVLIHDNVELPKTTTAAPHRAGPDPGPIYLQNHGNPVRYRNIWVLEKSPVN